MPASAPVTDARGNRIFPVETFGDTLIVSPKGDKAGFGESDYRVECGRVAAALKDPSYKHLVLDFSLTNYVGGNVVEELQEWVGRVRGAGGKAVACEVSPDMRKGLEVSKRADDWTFYETRDAALKAVATETPGQTLSRWAPRIAAGVAALALVGLVLFLMGGRREETERLEQLQAIWRDYRKVRDQYATPAEWKQHTGPLVDRLEDEIETIEALLPSEYPSRTPLRSTAKFRMMPVLRDPRRPDPRAKGVEAGFHYVSGIIAALPDEELEARRLVYKRTQPKTPESEQAAASRAARNRDSRSRRGRGDEDSGADAELDEELEDELWEESEEALEDESEDAADARPAPRRTRDAEPRVRAVPVPNEPTADAPAPMRTAEPAPASDPGDDRQDDEAAAERTPTPIASGRSPG